MARITEEKLSEARSIIEQGKFDDLIAWFKVNVPIGLDLAVAGPVFEKCFKAGDNRRALRLFEATVKDYDPTAQLTTAAFKIGWTLLKFAAVIGGCAYLFKVACG
jgi:hypothetical protein